MSFSPVQALRENCSGCGVCSALCPAHAITMQPDEEGFLTPSINESLCTCCNICRAVCPMTKSGHEKGLSEPDFFVATHSSSEVLSHSTSGGAFTALSDAVLSRDGVIYGADFDESLTVCHKRAETAEQRDRMRFSKYVQSQIHDVFPSIKKDLDDGRLVLFTGTPCQTAAIRTLFGYPDNLILCDLVCHGVPSPLLWKKYLEALAQEQGRSVTWASFRTKVNGWFRGQYQIYYHVAGKDELFEDTRFFELYLRGRYLLRPSCHACPYADTHRAADLTIADYWGIEKYSKEWCDRRGVSLILVHTQKGARLLESCTDLPHERRSPSEALNEQKRLSGPVSAPDDRELFWSVFRERGFAEAHRAVLSLHPELKA